MKKLITVHHHHVYGKYGFETSQLNRMTLAKHLNLPYVHLISGIVPYDDVTARFKELGFNYGSYIYLPELHLGKYVESGNIFYARFERGIAKYFRPEFDQDAPDDCNVDSWWFYEFKERAWVSEEDLIIRYLSQHSTKEDLIIRDDFRIVMPKLRRLSIVKHLNYYEYIHQDLIGNELLRLLTAKGKYLVASEYLTDYLSNLGYDCTFLAPISVEPRRKITDSIKKYVFVGDLVDRKNILQLFRIFNRLNAEFTVDVYGGTDEEFKRYITRFGKNVDNVIYKGFVNGGVPYDEYDGFISTSKSELFSNACVEAASAGLKCICNNIYLPFGYYNEMTDGDIEVCSSDDEFVDAILKNSNTRFDSEHSTEFLKKYSLQSNANRLLRLWNNH